MTKQMETLVRGYMEGKQLDESWRRKVLNSVSSIGIVFQAEIGPEDLTLCQLKPEQLWVNCEEEIDLPYADAIEQTLSVAQLAPITVVEYQGKQIIYMGSVRAVLYCRYQKAVDCIVVKLRTENAAAFSDAAHKRLSDFDIYQ